MNRKESGGLGLVLARRPLRLKLKRKENENCGGRVHLGRRVGTGGGKELAHRLSKAISSQEQ